jgi:hypothetical protein
MHSTFTRMHGILKQLYIDQIRVVNSFWFHPISNLKSSKGLGSPDPGQALLFANGKFHQCTRQGEIPGDKRVRSLGPCLVRSPSLGLVLDESSSVRIALGLRLDTWHPSLPSSYIRYKVCMWWACWSSRYPRLILCQERTDLLTPFCPN